MSSQPDCDQRTTTEADALSFSFYVDLTRAREPGFRVAVGEVCELPFTAQLRRASAGLAADELGRNLALTVEDFGKTWEEVFRENGGWSTEPQPVGSTVPRYLRQGALTAFAEWPITDLRTEVVLTEPLAVATPGVDTPITVQYTRFIPSAAFPVFTDTPEAKQPLAHLEDQIARPSVVDSASAHLIECSSMSPLRGFVVMAVATRPRP